MLAEPKRRTSSRAPLSSRRRKSTPIRKVDVPGLRRPKPEIPYAPADGATAARSATGLGEGMRKCRANFA